ncbi:MAG: cellulase family glycosylhydrolase [Verrucomicrobiota bacterium]
MTMHITRLVPVFCTLGLAAVFFPARHVAAATNSMPPRIRVAKDGRTFVTEKGDPFVPLGVNYYRPGTGWAPQLWKQFDAEATRKDFARMKELGLNCVRVFLSFGSFYREPGVLAPEGLSRFDQFLALAEEAGVYVHPTGPDHWEGAPEWTRTDRYADEKMLQAREDFWKLFAARYRGRTTIFAYDLLNEPEIGWESTAMSAKWKEWLRQKYGSAEKAAQAWGVSPEGFTWETVSVPERKDAPGSRHLLDYQHFRETLADAWTRRQATAIKAADPDALVTVGFIQWSVPVLVPSLSHYAAFRPDRQARFLDFLEIHFYPLESGFYEYGRAEGEARNLAYLESVVREVARPGKPVVVAEFGWHGGGKLTINEGKHPPATEADQARWCRLLVETTSGLAVGWLNWGFCDHPQARDVSQLTGLLTVDGKLKAWGGEFKKLAGALHQEVVPPAPAGAHPSLDWDLCLTSQQAAKEFREKYLQAFQAARRN